jgi:hypothetical protein
VTWGANTALVMPFFVFLMTNGNLLVSLNIFFMSFLYGSRYLKNHKNTGATKDLPKTNLRPV